MELKSSAFYTDYCELYTGIEVMLNAYNKKMINASHLRNYLKKFIATHPHPSEIKETEI